METTCAKMGPIYIMGNKSALGFRLLSMAYDRGIKQGGGQI